MNDKNTEFIVKTIQFAMFFSLFTICTAVTIILATFGELFASLVFYVVVAILGIGAMLPFDGFPRRVAKRVGIIDDNSTSLTSLREEIYE